MQPTRGWHCGAVAGHQMCPPYLTPFHYHLLPSLTILLYCLQVLENGHQVAVEGAERVLAALEGKYIRSYPYAGYDVEHRH